MSSEEEPHLEFCESINFEFFYRYVGLLVFFPKISHQRIPMIQTNSLAEGTFL